LTLQEAIEAAMKSDPRIAAARSEDKVYDAKAFQAKWAVLQGSCTGTLNPITEMRGDAVNSDSGEFPLTPGNALGVFTRHEFSLFAPLITFGKLGAGKGIIDAASSTGEELVRRAQADVAQDVRRAYFAALLADDVLDLMQEASKQLSDARAEIEKDIAADGENFTRLDLHKLDYFEAELKARAAEAKAGLTITRAALGLLTGNDTPVHPKEDFLAPLEGKLPNLQELKTTAMSNRPEVRLLEIALKAKTNEAKLMKAFLYPDIGAYANGMFSFDNVADNQTSPFAYDPYNQRYANIGISMRYSLDVGVKLGKARESAAGQEQITSLRDAALGGISIEIEKLYNDALSAQSRIAIREGGNKAAKKWLTSVYSDFIVGNAETRDMIEALLASGESNAKYLQATLEYNLAIGALSRAVGVDPVLTK
jgi:outer membrane protein TolC